MLTAYASGERAPAPPTVTDAPTHTPDRAEPARDWRKAGSAGFGVLGLALPVVARIFDFDFEAQVQGIAVAFVLLSAALWWSRGWRAPRG
jgi:hypothetical protein